jgi:hypothetical protein
MDYQAVAGKVPSTASSKIAPLMRQAQVNVLRSNFVGAERILQDGLEKYTNDPYPLP